MQIPLKVCQIATARFREDQLGTDSHLRKSVGILSNTFKGKVFYAELEFACWIIQAQWTFLMFDLSVCETLQCSWIKFHIVW